MPTISLSELYSEMQKEMLQSLQTGASAFTHPGTKGDTTETNWIDWLRTYLPARYKVDKAIIIDSKGKQSDAIDLVIYDAQYSYMVFQHNGEKLIPAESVYAVFEVKQVLNKEYIEYAGRKAQSVRTLFRTSASIPHAGGQYAPKPLHDIIAGLLTTWSPWTPPIIDNTAKYMFSLDADKQLDLVCSVANNTFIWERNASADNPTGPPSIRYCEKDDSLVFLFLNLLQRLQAIGTVPAIDYNAYAQHISSNFYMQK